MKTVKTSAPYQEQQCPACARKFTVGTNRGRLRCPHCREIVVLTAPRTAIGISVAQHAPAPSVAEDWRTQCDILERRFEALEDQVKSCMAATARAEELLLTPGRAHDDCLTPRDTPSQRQDAAEPRENANGNAQCKAPGNYAPAQHAEVRDVPAQNTPAPVITLLASSQDIATHRLARTLTEILSRAGWGVHESSNVTTRCGHGLTLAVAPTLSRERLTTTFNALRVAGFSVTLQFDPQLGADETLLIVGPGVVSENSAND
jgi:hypothetical protein